MEKIRNLSLKKSIVLYMTLSLICIFLISAFIVITATHVQQQVWWRYVDAEIFFQAQHSEADDYEVVTPRPARSEMSEMDWNISEFCDILETYAVLVLSIAGNCIAIILWYRNKLKVPINQLCEASRRIASDQLDFQVLYENWDELGELCKEFEKMRSQLEENNKALWRMTEDERALRAAIAHDIRSPLSVLKGYQEMLLKFIPEGSLDTASTLDMLQEGMKQIVRMNSFIDTMKDMTKLDERELSFAAVGAEELGCQIQKEAEIISREAKKICTVLVQTTTPYFYIDSEIILEVTENLLSNALRYASEKTEIILSSNGTELILTVLDDGQGFTEKPEMLTKAFYHSNPQDDLQHFGMGMYISRIYCERHGGCLLIGNQTDGGGEIKAVFHSYLPNP